ncbi:hypothetical protein HA052_00140 [Chromobacterium haemolyticum]|uniref:Uncharacterized protein n=1 Tax=Chromobacterium fluminis TaxID=3044269 RepID=A0ABX0KYB6_9NEIS|nr:hypothetical protein [Chromobacterium haemolyticum]NHR03590.1 hypothetical protein [Chromobacterium haemolyticum]
MKPWIFPLILMAGIGAGLAQMSPASVPRLPLLPVIGMRPAPIPAQPPASLGRQEWRSQQDVILIEDRLAGTQYLSTLGSSGGILPGSQPQAIFGARAPRGGAKKVATWYTHKPDAQVREISQLQPLPAFRGMADSHGATVGLSGDVFRPAQGRQVNPVLSELAFDTIAKAAPGASRELSFVETLAGGDERRFVTQVSKRAHLILNPAPVNSCRNETVEGAAGKLCVLRTIAGQSNASSGGDLMFTVRAKMVETPKARFRVGGEWRHINDSVPIAAFARARTVEVFFVPPPAEQRQAFIAAHPKIRLDTLVEAGFYSRSRLFHGDRFNLQLPAMGGERPFVHKRYSRLGLLLIDDQSSGRQYVTTVNGSQDQAIYGERHPQNGTRAAAWYLESGARPPLFALQQLGHASPIGGFAGFADAQGQIQSGVSAAAPFLNPVFSESAFAVLLHQPLGGQRRLTVEGLRSGGETVAYQVNASQQARLTLAAPVETACRPDLVDGVAGQRCVLRRLEMRSRAGGDIRLLVRAKRPLPGGRFRAGGPWHNLGESVAVAELAGASRLELFLPAADGLLRGASAPVGGQPLSTLVDAYFYSSGRQQQGDRFPLSLPQSYLPTPVAGVGSLKLLTIEDQPSQQHYLTTLQAEPGQSLYGARRPRAGQRAATWYVDAGTASVRGGELQAKQALPLAFIAGFSDREGRVSLGRAMRQVGQIHPVFNERAFAEWLRQPLGGRQLLTLEAERGGQPVTVRAQAEKSAALRLGPPLSGCRPETVDGIEGRVCALRSVEDESQAKSGGAVRFSIRSRQALPKARFRVGTQPWHRLGESVEVAQFAGAKAVELFLPPAGRGRRAEAMEAVFYSGERDDVLTLPLEAPQPTQRGGEVGFVFGTRHEGVMKTVPASITLVLNEQVVAGGPDEIRFGDVSDSVLEKKAHVRFSPAILGEKDINLLEPLMLPVGTQALTFEFKHACFGKPGCTIDQNANTKSVDVSFNGQKPPDWFRWFEKNEARITNVSVNPDMVSTALKTEVEFAIDIIDGPGAGMNDHKLECDLHLTDQLFGDPDAVELRDNNGQYIGMLPLKGRQTLHILPAQHPFPVRFKLRTQTGGNPGLKTVSCEYNYSGWSYAAVNAVTEELKLVSIDGPEEGRVGDDLKYKIFTKGVSLGGHDLTVTVAGKGVPWGLETPRLQSDDGEIKPQCDKDCVFTLRPAKGDRVSLALDIKAKSVSGSRDDYHISVNLEGDKSLEKDFSIVPKWRVASLESSGDVVVNTPLRYRLRLNTPTAEGLTLWLRTRPQDGEAADDGYQGGRVTVKDGDKVLTSTLNTGDWGAVILPQGSDTLVVEVPTQGFDDSRRNTRGLELGAVLSESKPGAEPPAEARFAVGRIYQPKPSVSVLPAREGSNHGGGWVGEPNGRIRLDYLVSAQMANLPPSGTLERGAARRYLSQRSLGAVKAVLSLDNQHGASQREGMCRFALKDDERQGVLFPAWVAFDAAAGGGRLEADNCAGTVQHDLSAGAWLDDGSDPAQGLEKRKLPFSVLFPLDDPVSLQTMQGAPWYGRALGAGAVRVEMGLELAK